MDSDLPVPEMLSQEAETDWGFDCRIANQYGKQVFVNSKTTGCQIHVGNLPFAVKEPGAVLSTSLGRDVDKVRAIQAGVSQSASVFEFEETTLTVSDLTIGAGYAISYEGRTQTVTRSEIHASQGTLVNEVTLVHGEGVMPEAARSQGTTKHSSILTGTVTAVDGTNVMVDFHTPGDTPRWMPYASAVSNYFYSMPDIGDTVFVYYETGDSEKVVCLGSRHVNESPDFSNSKNKMMTANNRMVKFAEKEVDLVGNRSEYDGSGGEQAKIIFNDETGIEIQSTKDISLKAEEKITLQALKGSYNGIEEVKQKFDQKYGEGDTKYKAEGGTMEFDALSLLSARSYHALKKNIDQNLKAPFQVIGTLKELTGKIGGSAGTEGGGEAEAAPVFEDGTAHIMSLDRLVLQVGTTCVTFAGGVIQIRTNAYLQLGTDRSATYEHLEDANYTWKDMFLDMTQCALDIVGALPIPGVSTVANLANAGISLARGDYVGAAISAGTAALSLIPGANTVGGMLKGASGIAKLGKKMKAAGTLLNAVKKFSSGAINANLALTAVMAVGDIGTAIKDGTFDMNDPKCRQDVMSILQGGSSLAKYKLGKSKTRGKNGKERFKSRGERETERQGRKDARQKRVQAAAGAVDNVRKKTRAKLDEYSANRCTKGEPIDMVTGSYLIEQCDLLINDIGGRTAIERTYESLLSGEESPVGKGWTLSIFSRAYLYDERIEILLPDQHTETFLKTAEGYRNRRGGTKRLTLTEEGEGYRLTEENGRTSWFYDQDGRLLSATDRNGNRTLYEYSGENLAKICFTSGQYLLFTWQGDKIIRMKDCIGRTVEYRYEDGYLTAVTMVNGGTETYGYDTAGRIKEITDANGNTYVHNEYDRKGRVTRQSLSNGQEYILFYEEEDRVNTYLVPKNGQETRHHYNLLKQLVRTEYEDGTTEEYGYDAWENRVWEKDRNGNETRREYDEAGHLLKLTEPSGREFSYEYEAGNCIHKWDNTGMDSRYTYDRAGNLKEEIQKVEEEKSRSYRFTYDSYGRITAFEDPEGSLETYEYGHLFGEEQIYINAGGEKTLYGYDEAGRLMLRTDMDGTRRYTYNHFDLLCQASDPLGHSERYVYDGVLDLVQVVRANQYGETMGAESGDRYRYDAFHHQTMHIDAAGGVYALHLDGEGNPVKEIHPNTYRIEDKDGEGIINQYDASDNKYKIQYPDGGTRRLWYDANGNITKVCNPEQYEEKTDDGPGYLYEYDSADRLVQITGPEGEFLHQYTYDLAGNLIKAVHGKNCRKAEETSTGDITGNSSGDRAGNSTGDRIGNRTGVRTEQEEAIGELYSYNSLGWLLESRTPMEERDGAVRYQLIRYEYDLSGNRIKELRYCDYQTRESHQGEVHTISYEYDRKDHLIRVSDRTGAVLEYGYDGKGRRTLEKRKINQSNEQVFRYFYDEGGRIVKVSRSADQKGCGKETVSVRYEYDKNGNNTQVVLPSGGEILREYDAADRLIKETHREKKSGIHNTTGFAYDKAGNLLCITDNQGRKTQIEYDLLNREIQRTERDGGITRQFYDTNGQLVKVIRPREYEASKDAGAGTVYTYDTAGRLLTILRPDGKLQESYVYDTDGNLIQTLDGTGSGARFDYDLGGRRTRVETEGKATQSYTYDAYGNITGLCDGENNKTEYVLDKWGRITEIKKADGSQERYGYDYAGNITESVDGEGNRTTYEYNAANLLSSLTDPAGEMEQYQYEEEGRLYKKLDRNGIETAYTYNLYGNIQSRRAGELSEVYEYTPEGLLKSAIAEGMRYSYTYDAMGRLTEKKASGRPLLSFTYDKNGNLWKQKDVTGKMTEYRYTINDEIKEIWDDGKLLAEYNYNEDGTVKNLKNGESLYTEYAYDKDKNLTGLRNILAGEVLADNHYRYDGNGNRTRKHQLQGDTSYTYDSLNRLTKVQYPGSWEELTYDKAGNRTGRRSPSGEELYQYDSRNRLTSHTVNGVIEGYTYDNAGNLLKDGKNQYTYDAFHRTSRVETFDGAIQINRYDAEGLRHEMEENGNLVQFIFRGTEVAVEESKGEIKRYIRSDVLLASDAESARTYYHYASDELGSITHVTEGEEVLNWYEYDAWGNVTESQEKAENRFKFNGQQLDPISQQYYLRARYYNPIIGRFTQEDTYWGDGLNLYAYCANNPVYYVDPSGNICKKAADRIMSLMDEGRIKGKNKRQLESYLRNKINNGGLNPAEQEVANKLNINIDNKGAGEARLIPGEDGIVTGGNSTKLGQNLFEDMGLPRTTSRTPYQAMHIIPKELRSHPVIKKIGMDFDDVSNGIFLRNRKSGGVSPMSRHEGFHKVYNRFIEGKLDNLDINLSTSELERQVFDLQQKGKYLMEQGLPMYEKEGASIDLWERWFNK
ncbi:RHS repeat-associated core domain-containing protein [Anaerocolumna jejuensis]|uniref:RHS repeat-associated core domain-containing protein n=1 Tax=Anaerocolumna jejuensis TaxID=259063 RepID=UPI001A9A32BF|nr:RHS repeat-associated core domain-containing protein [Anaerocolumna jejuensis]